MTRSIEMSFSASRLFSTDTSMSIGFLLAGVIGVVYLVESSELHLHPARAKLAQAESAPRTVDLERDAVLIRADNPPQIFDRTSGSKFFRILIFCDQRYDDHPAGGATPVPWLRQRSVDSRRGHLERVRSLAHRVRRVELGRHLPAHLSDVVEADAAVGVDDDPQ